MDTWIEQQQPKKPPFRTVLTQFLLAFLFSGAAFSVLVYGVLKLQANQQLAALKVREAAKVEIAGSVLARHFQEAVADLQTLTHSPEITQLIARDDPGSRALARRLFTTVVDEKKFYDQIRYIDTRGMEVVRVNQQYGMAVVPDALLHNKGERSFFQESSRLQAGNIYLSPLDLNIENGSLDIPYRPMIRLATPVFDPAGARKGIVILTIHGSWLIDGFRRAMGNEHQAMLLNRDGDLLAGPDPALEWGFMSGRPSGFALRNPVEWQAMAKAPGATLEGPAGLLTYLTLFPLQASPPSAPGAGRQGADQGAYFWRVVSLVPAAELPSAGILLHPRALYIYAGGLLLLLGFNGYLAHIVVSWRQSRQAVIESATQLCEITSMLGEGVIVLDREGALTYANPEAERLLGWTSAELLGQDAHALFHYVLDDGSAAPAAGCAIRRVISSAETYRSMDETFVRKDGTTFPVGLSAAPLLRERVVTGSVLVFRDTTELKRNQEEVRQLAFHDPLTNLPNRRLLVDRLQQALGNAQRHRRSLALMYLDLDHFKYINDTYGHDGGDELLKGIAERLRQTVRSTDTVVRQGGDEFVVLLPEIGSPEDAAIVARQILDAMSEPVPVKGHMQQITASIGIALYPGSAYDADGLMLEADTAMYAAKEAGRNRYSMRGMGAEGAHGVDSQEKNAPLTTPDVQPQGLRNSASPMAGSCGHIPANLNVDNVK